MTRWMAGLLLLAPGLAAAGTLELPIATDFEGITTEVAEEFSIGPAGQEATFGGAAFSGSLGLFQLYNSGFFSWMVEPGGSGSVVFASGATDVRFFATASSGGDASFDISVQDRGGAVIDTASVSPGAGFQEFAFSGDIGSIVFENLSTAAQTFGAVDDFSYAPVEVPEPLRAALLMLSAALPLLRRRRS